MNYVLTLTPNGITKFLLKIIACLLLANLISVYLKWELGYVTGFGFVPLFDFDQEYNIPTFYSALAILFCAALLWYIGVDKKETTREGGRYWKILSVLFVGLSLDELAGIHNQFGHLTLFLFSKVPSIVNEEIITRSRFWILVLIPLLLLVALFFVRFYKKLPQQTKFYIFLAGTVFLAGAVVLEYMGALYIITSEKVDIVYGLLYTLEELLEMLGIVLLIRTLVAYISQYTSDPQINTQLLFFSHVADKSKNRQAESSNNPNHRN